MTRPTTYRNGCLVRYTGATEVAHGALWYIGTLEEGPRKGTAVVTMRPPYLGPAVPEPLADPRARTEGRSLSPRIGGPIP